MDISHCWILQDIRPLSYRALTFNYWIGSNTSFLKMSVLPHYKIKITLVSIWLLRSCNRSVEYLDMYWMYQIKFSAVTVPVIMWEQWWMMRLDPDMINLWKRFQPRQQLPDNAGHWLDVFSTQAWINTPKDWSKDWCYVEAGANSLAQKEKGVFIGFVKFSS